MSVLKTFFISVLCLCGLVNCDELKTLSDSYLVALENSHRINAEKSESSANRIAREDFSQYQPVYQPQQYEPTIAYVEDPPTSYGAPIQQSGGPYPPASYGPPPQPAYGPPPKPVYGPPPPAPMYGPPVYGRPYANTDLSVWLFNKIKSKINLYTLAKILLKLVLFVKVVKFIALICLLLFIPSLKPKEEDEDTAGSDESRKLYNPRGIARLLCNIEAKY